MMSGYQQQNVCADPAAADIIGWHNMYWSEGQMKVCFRPGGQFFCAEHQTSATWQIYEGEILVDWQECGRYVLNVDEGKHLKGHALPKHDEDPKNWRKTLYFGQLTPVEKLLFGDGDGTEWELKGPEGTIMTFEVRCDGNNHIVFPGQSGDGQWSLDKKGTTLKLDGGKKGKFELEIDVKDKTMDGYIIIDGKDDPDEDKDCRDAVFKRNLVKPPPITEGDDEDVGDGQGHGHSHGGEGHTHGEGHGSHDFGGGIVSLGNVTIASEKFMVDRENQLDKGFETTFGLERVGAGKATGFSAWVQDGKGNPVSDPVEGDKHDDHCHLTVVPKTSGAEVLAIKCGDDVSTINVRPGAAPASDGILSVLEDEGGNHVGFIELKLHDDAGDLELWLCKDGPMSVPFDIPAGTTITATFATHDNRSVQLNVRNNEENEDEDGKPNMRDGQTNYFVFPGESEQDPEFLIGEKFRSTTTLTFEAGGKKYTAPPFILVPHQH